jgi:hypothetical protein
MRRALLYGLALWLVGTIAIRLGGYRMLDPAAVGRTLLLYAAGFAAMAVLVPRICRSLGFRRTDAFAAAAALILPTLVLDPFSCLFFTKVFPRADPAAAGIFGGWMLAFCGGAVAGVWARSGREA